LAWLKRVYDTYVNVDFDVAYAAAKKFDGLEPPSVDDSVMVVGNVAYSEYHSYKTTDKLDDVASAFFKGLTSSGISDAFDAKVLCWEQSHNDDAKRCNQWYSSLDAASKDVDKAALGKAINPKDFFWAQHSDYAGVGNAMRYSLSTKPDDRGAVFGCILKDLVKEKKCRGKVSLFAPNQAGMDLMLADNIIMYFVESDQVAVLAGLKKCIAGKEDTVHAPEIMHQVAPGIYEADEPTSLKHSFGTSRGQVAGEAADAYHVGKKTTFDEYKALFFKRYADCGLDPDQPWKNKGEPLEDCAFRLW